MEKYVEDCAKLLKENKDPIFQNLHTLVNNLYLDLNSFKENFKTIIRNLNDLLTQKLITQEIYDNCLHIISRDITVYLNNKTVPIKILVYYCDACKKYFLEQDGNSLKEEVHTKINLNYSSNGFCSEMCQISYHPNLADIIIDDPK